ncbi:hypothetical protein ACFX2J_046739 [Malus domestica]
MNSNFGSSSDSDWGSLSNSKREAKWAQMRREDEESGEEVQVRRNKQNIAVAIAAAMKWDRTGRPSFSPHQKVTVALRMMAYGSPADSIDETYGMSESTCLDTLQEFCDTIVQLYKDEYFREPNQEDLNRLLRKAEDRGFPGMIGSLDCMHWDWKNCPTEWQ